eukprot:g2521.t1
MQAPYGSRPEVQEVNEHIRSVHDELVSERRARKRLERDLHQLRREVKSRDMSRRGVAPTAVAPAAPILSGSAVAADDSPAERSSADAQAISTKPQAWAINTRLQRMGHGAVISPAHRASHKRFTKGVQGQKRFSKRRNTMIRAPRPMGGLRAMMRATPDALDVDNILQRLDHYLRCRAMRPIDLFREMGKHPTQKCFDPCSLQRIPVQYSWKLTAQERGEPNMFSASDFRTLLNTRLNMRLTSDEVHKVVVKIDADGNGKIDLQELEQAIALARQAGGRVRRAAQKDAMARYAAKVRAGERKVLYRRPEMTEKAPAHRSTPFGERIDNRVWSH